MTRILYWNINNFSLPKIWAARPPVAGVQAAIRNNFIVNLVMTGPTGGPAPDIIVVVEVYSRVREVGIEGTVLNAGGRGAGAGVLTLLTNIRNAMGNQWCVVPPLNVGEFGQREAVAVFYNSARLQFTGPNLYFNRYPGTPGTVVGQAQPVNAATYALIIDYPLLWKNGLPYPTNPLPALRLNRQRNFMIGGVATPINEWQLAGEWQYWTGVRQIPSPEPLLYPNNRIQFPNQGCRGPFWTQFSDLTFAGGRLINLFTVHTSPGTAQQAVRQMQRANEMTAVPAGRTVNVILGDFNVDSFGAGGFGGGINAYGWMAVAPGIYTMQLDPRVGHAGAINMNRQPYCMTHLLPVADATPFNTGGGAPSATRNVYPRYGYMGTSWPQLMTSGAIDNVFTAYGAGAGAATNITVVNKVVGTPYNRLPFPLGVTGELTGGRPFASSLANPIPQAAAPGGINPPVCTIWFPQIFNFGQIRDTSDHLPLMIDI